MRNVGTDAHDLFLFILVQGVQCDLGQRYRFAAGRMGLFIE